MSTQAVTAPDNAATDMVTDLHTGDFGLDHFLELVSDTRGPLIKGRDGGLTLVSPSFAHERRSDRLHHIVLSICDGLEIECLAASSAHFRRPGFDHGIEADQSYYVRNEPSVRGVVEDHIDLAVYPPPDLMIEAVVPHGPEKALQVYRELRVPEVWVDYPRGGRLDFLRLAPRGARAGTYVSTKASRAFPFLKITDVEPWLRVAGGESDMAWRRRAREWVRGELLPRVRPGGRG